MEIRLSCIDPGDLAGSVFPAIRQAQLNGVEVKKLTEYPDNQLGEPVTIAILIAIASGAAGAVAGKASQLVWDKVAEWVKRSGEPVEVQGNGVNVRITPEMTNPTKEFEDIFKG